MNLRTYQANRASGVVWLGDVPESWRVKRLKYVFPVLRSGVSVNSEKSPTSDEAPGVLKTSCVYGNRFRPEENKRVLESDLERLACPVTGNSLIVSRMNTPELVGSCGLVESDYLNLFLPDRLWIATFAKESQLDVKYAWYLVTSHLFVSLTASLATGTSDSMKNLTKEAFLGISAPVPTKNEQQAIGKYLDDQIGKIDQLITEKNGLIDRLTEKRSALISRTVTHGLPPEAARAAGLPENPLLKPSTFDWMGEIPSHWGVVPLRYAFHNLDYRRIPVAGEDRAALKKTYPYYGASGIIDFVDEFIFDETLILVAEDGANLLSRSTPLAFLATGKYWVNNHAHILKPIKGDIRYWAAVLQTYDFSPLVTGAAQPKLTSDNLGGIRLPNPPPNEQSAIADYLGFETAKIDVLVIQVESAIKRLQEYRGALINAAVSGKIDVRKAIA